MDEPIHELLDMCTIIVDKEYPQVTGELFALLVAHELFRQLALRTHTGPQGPFTTICHARDTVNGFIVYMVTKQ